MKSLVIFLLIAALCVSFGCSKAQTMSSHKILIVYFSRTKNTKAVAEMIQQNVGGTLVALELVTPYPEDYKAQ